MNVIIGRAYLNCCILFIRILNKGNCDSETDTI